MQVYTKTDRVSLKSILIFVLILVVAYLPISSFLFFLKNDAFDGYFPPKFFMSESLRAGYLPLWNPYINYGLPQYGDMSSAFWSPFTWLFAATVGYNAYTFTIEELIYLLIGCVGMFRLLRLMDLDKLVCFAGAIAYLCCGYNVGNLQHFNWISGAALLPWCMWSYLRFYHHRTFRNVLLTALIFYIFVASAHPGLSIAAFYFFVPVSVFLFFDEKEKTFVKKIGSYISAHAKFLIATGLLSIGMIIAYADILPHITRGEKVSEINMLANATTFQSWISALLPFGTVKNDVSFNTDISMRNIYFGLGSLLFFLVALFSKKSRWEKLLLITGILFLLLSTGGIFKIFGYKFIPMIGYVRLNGEFRIISIFCFIIIACTQMNRSFAAGLRFEGSIARVYYGLKILLGIAIVTGLYQAFHSGQSIVLKGHDIFQLPGITAQMKGIIDSISFYDTLWIQGTLQMLFLWLIQRALRRNNKKLLIKVLITELVLAALMNIPFTGAGQTSVAHIQTILNMSPKGIPTPGLQPINTNSAPDESIEQMVGSWSFYSKQPGNKTFVIYPVTLRTNEIYLDHLAEKSFLDQPLLFNSDPAIQDISIEKFTPGKITIKDSIETDGQLVYQQNYYPHWFYSDGHEKKAAEIFSGTFLSAPVKTGNNRITFSFEPTLVKTGLLLSALFFIAAILLLLFLRRRP